MNTDSVLETIRAHKEDLAQYNVESLALFGSAARNEAGSESDVNLLVEFNMPVGLFEFVRLQQYLEAILGFSVDLATPDALHKSMRTQILAESIYA